MDKDDFAEFRFILDDLNQMERKDLPIFLALLIQILFKNKCLTEKNIHNIFYGIDQFKKMKEKL